MKHMDQSKELQRIHPEFVDLPSFEDEGAEGDRQSVDAADGLGSSRAADPALDDTGRIDLRLDVLREE